MAESIDSWLKGNRDYKEGVLLYEKHGNNTALLRLLKKGSNSFTKESLVKGLKQIITTSKEEEQEESFNSNIKIRANTKQLELPSEIIELQQRQRALRKERDYMKGELIHLHEKDRFTYVEKIMENSHEIADIYKELDHYNATGMLLSEKKKKQFNPSAILEIERNIQNLRTRISKAKKRNQQEKLTVLKGELSDLEKKKAEFLRASQN